MGLQLALPTPYGVNALYWKLYRIDDINFNTKTIHGYLAGYVSKAVRDADINTVISTKDFTMALPDRFDGDIRDTIYANLKLGDWSQAVDVLE